MRTILLVLTFGVLFPLNAQPSEDQTLEKAMFYFDQAFIPTWYAVQHEQFDDAAQYMVFLKHAWQDLNDNYVYYKKDNIDWQEAFRRIGVWLDGAEDAMAENCQTWAYNQLDHARYELGILRRQNGVHYQLDALYDFEIMMGDVLEVVNDQMLCLLEWNEFEFLAKEMEEKWMVVVDNPWDIAFYEMDDTEELLLNEAMQELEQELQNFKQTLNTGQQCIAADVGKELELAYWRLLIRFGDFDPKANILN